MTGHNAILDIDNVLIHLMYLYIMNLNLHHLITKTTHRSASMDTRQRACARTPDLKATTSIFANRGLYRGRWRCVRVGVRGLSRCVKRSVMCGDWDVGLILQLCIFKLRKGRLTSTLTGRCMHWWINKHAADKYSNTVQVRRCKVEDDKRVDERVIDEGEEEGLEGGGRSNNKNKLRELEGWRHISSLTL